jgi:hypothetical protein
MISRRKFLSITGAAGAVAFWSSSCSGTRDFPITMKGGNAALGHRLRSMDFPPPTQSLKCDVAVIGGGIAGLSAARYLANHGVDFRIFELEDVTGGNARGDKNHISAFPWGAHYLPLPNNEDSELVAFLREEQVITGMKDGLPIFNEYYLCHDPKERLYINHLWQDGLIPHEGVPKQDRDQIQQFLERMNEFRLMTGRDGKQAFTIPVDKCSADPEITALDMETAANFLHRLGYNSPYLRWYVNYCCADDFGTSVDDTSAWAMIHYFASRKGQAQNASPDAVLTWPEGNYWLAQRLRAKAESRISTGNVIYQVAVKDGVVECLAFDAAANLSKIIIANKVILATPQFINARLLTTQTREIDYSSFRYSPWMVANLLTDHSLNERRGEPLSWDNVIYGSDALGYVNAMHQQLHAHPNQKIITYYKPLLGSDPMKVRTAARDKSSGDWKHEIIKDLSMPHPGIENVIQEMSIWLWGHGMVRPEPGFVFSNNRKNALKPIDNKIFFAHSDLSGLSIFEEAFYRGHMAAKSVLAS